MTLGEKIKKLRIENGLTQEEMAEKLYLSRQAVTAWEGNRTKPDIESLTILSKLFNVPLKYFLDEDEKSVVEPKINKKCIRPLPIILAIVLIAISISIGFMLSGSNRSHINSSITEENIVGSYLSLDNIEVDSIDELLESNLPYLVEIDGILHTNLMIEEKSGYVSYLNEGSYEKINHFKIYFDDERNSYSFIMYDKPLESSGMYIEVADYKIKYNIVSPNRYMQVISYDSDSNIIRDEVFKTTLAGNIINSDGSNIEGIYLDTYYVPGASYYTVRLGMDQGNNKIYNVFNTSELHTNLSCSGIKLSKLLMTKFIID